MFPQILFQEILSLSLLSFFNYYYYKKNYKFKSDSIFGVRGGFALFPQTT